MPAVDKARPGPEKTSKGDAVLCLLQHTFVACESPKMKEAASPFSPLDNGCHFLFRYSTRFANDAHSSHIILNIPLQYPSVSAKCCRS